MNFFINLLGIYVSSSVKYFLVSFPHYCPGSFVLLKKLICRVLCILLILKLCGSYYKYFILVSSLCFHFLKASLGEQKFLILI